MYSGKELDDLKKAALLLEKYKFSQPFGDVAGALQKVIDAIEINAGSKGLGKDEFVFPEKIPHIRGSEYLPQIIEAIGNEKVLRIYYQPFYEDKPYFTEIHPYLLKEYKNRWYLVGLNDFKEQIRTFSLDRIRDIQDSDINYRKKDFEAAEYFQHSIGIISPQGEPPKVSIAVQKTQAQYMITQPWHESQNIEEETEDYIVFGFKIHPTYEFLSLLLSYGKDLKVLGPPALKEQIRSQLEEMINYYR